MEKASMTVDENGLFKGVELGIGTWAWGDRLVWNYGQGYSDQDIVETFKIATDNGIQFFDTAEIYGQGKSELFIGRLLKNNLKPIKIATKFMPYPWRLNAGALRKSLKASLERLDLPKVQLYQMHMPIGLLPIKTWMTQMAEVQKEGLIEAIGVRIMI
jgi:aryl-alcohol dehydrogenase-like predicted oxidoreductase